MLKGYTEQQWDVVQENAHNQLQVAKMKIHGVDRWTEDDYKFAFLVKKGIIKIPKGPIWNPQTHMMGGNNEDNIKRGLFNVKRWLGNSISSMDPYAEDPFPELAEADTTPEDPSKSFPWMSAGSGGGNGWDKVPRNTPTSAIDSF